MNSEHLPYLVFGVFALMLVGLVWTISRNRTKLAEERRHVDRLQQELKREEQRSRTLKETVDRLTALDRKQNPWNPTSASRSAPAPSPRRLSSSVTELPTQSSPPHSTHASSPPVDNTLTNALLFSHMASSSPSPSPAPSYDMSSSGGSSDSGCSGSFD